MEAGQYIAENLAQARAYHAGVLDGSIVSSKWIKLQAQRFDRDLADAKYYFNEPAVRRVFEFFAQLPIAIRGEIKQFKITPSQAWIIYHCFGIYKHENNTRKIRRVYLFTAKKSGKTTFAAAIQLYMMCYDGEAYSDSILVAGSREQANIAYDAALKMVTASEVLKAQFNYNETRAITWHAKRHGKCRLFTKPSKDLSFDGVNVHGGILDEAHVHKEWKLANNMVSASAERNQPMIFITSTAGFNMTYPFFNKVKVGERVLLGELEEDITAYFFYTLDEGDDPEDPDVWPKSNPNIGQTVTWDFMLNEFKTAKLDSDTWINFLVKNLNIWVNEAAQWIDDEDLMAANEWTPPDGSPRPRMEDFKENDFFVGADLSHTTDFNVHVWLTEKDGIFYAWGQYYCTKKTNRKRTGGVDISHWIAAGWAYLFEKKKNFDLEKIGDDILATRARAGYVRSLTYDPFNAKDLIFKLESEGVYCEPMRQVTGEYNEPTKALERLLHNGQIVLDGNPLNVFHLRNVVLAMDSNNNYKPDKKKSLDAIDFCMALAMALKGYLKLYNSDFYHAVRNYNHEEAVADPETSSG